MGSSDSRIRNASRLAHQRLEKTEAMSERLDKLEGSAAVPDDFMVWLESRPTRGLTWKPRHLRRIVDALNAVTRGEVLRLILSMPPRHGKTEILSRYAAYRLEKDQADRIIWGSHSQRLANRVSRRVRRLVRNRIEFAPDARSVEDWETVAGGGMRSVGVGGGIAGHGGNVIALDDIVRNREEAESSTVMDTTFEWLTDDIWTRAEPGAAIVIINTRWSPQDPVGRLLERDDADQWTMIRFPANAEEDDPLGRGAVECPTCGGAETMVTCGTCGGSGEVGEALWPERYDEEALADIARMLGPRSFAGLYQQQPRPREGDFFKWDWFQAVESAPAASGLRRCRAWDTAGSDNSAADYTAGVLMTRTEPGLYVVEDVTRFQASPGRRDALIKATAERDAATYGRGGVEVWLEQEAGVAGVERTQATIRLLAGHRARAERVTGSKINRADPLAAQAEAGNVKLVKASWNGDFLAELCDFPGGRNDDQVDAASMAFTKLAGSARGAEIIPWRVA